MMTMIEINHEKWILIAGLTLLIFAAFTAHAGAAAIYTNKDQYKMGETVTIYYDFGDVDTKLHANDVARISIYRDPEFILHTVTWDAYGTKGTQKWDTRGLWDGTYYVVLKWFRPMGLLFEEEIIQISKFSITSGAKEQQPIITIQAQMKIEFIGNLPTLSPEIFSKQQAEVISWSVLAS